MKGLLKIMVCCLVFIGYARANSDEVKVECTSCKDKSGNSMEINRNLTIQYTIRNFLTFKLSYEIDDNDVTKGITLVNVLKSGTVKKQKTAPPRFIFSNATTKSNTVIFNFTMMYLNSSDTGKDYIFSYIRMDEGGTDHNGFTRISIIASPEFRDWKGVIRTKEGNSLSFTFSLFGKPKPKVTVNFLGIKFNVSEHSEKDNVHKYNATSRDNLLRSQCGEELTVHASSDGTSKNPHEKAQVIVDFIPEKPKIESAKIDLSKCLIVKWKAVEAGKCNVAYTLKFGDQVVVNNTDKVEFKGCNDTRYNISSSRSVYVRATVNDKSSEYNNATVEILRTTGKPPVTLPVQGGGAESSLPTWAIIVIAIVGFIILLVIFLVILACFNVIKCCYFGKDRGKRNSRTKPSSDEERRALKAKSSKGDTSFTVTFQNIHNQDVKLLWKDFNGEESPVQIIDSKKDCMEKVYITYSFIARDVTNNQLLYFTDNKKTDVVYEGLKFGAERDQVYNIIITSKPPLDLIDGKSKKSKKRMNGATNQTFVPDSTEMKPVEGEYAVVNKPRNKPIVESNYSEAGYFAKPQNSAASQPLDYAELGPGGRTGDRPTPVQQSNYAQVNTQAGNYPPLQNDKHMPIYAVSSKAKNRLPAPDPPIAVDDDDDMSIVV